MTYVNPLDLNSYGGIQVEQHQPKAQVMPQVSSPFMFGASGVPSIPLDLSLFNMPTLPSLPAYNFSLPNLFPVKSLDFSKYFTQTNNSGLSKDYAQEFKEEKAEKSKRNLPSGSLLSLGYNASKGQKLAQIAMKNTVGFIGKCATYAKKDIEEAGLGKYECGHAYQCDDILRRNPNFKEISTEGLDLKKLPAGCVLVYERGVSRYSKLHGHIEITNGDGSASSDGKTNNIRPGAQVFIPV